MAVRIVLVDPFGDVLFSGESILAGEIASKGESASPRHTHRPGDPREAEEEEEGPETLRSATSESGIYPSVDRTAEDAAAPATGGDEIRSPRHRAA
jgi:hypothetical protein